MVVGLLIPIEVKVPDIYMTNTSTQIPTVVMTLVKILLDGDMDSSQEWFLML